MTTKSKEEVVSQREHIQRMVDGALKRQKDLIIKELESMEEDHPCGEESIRQAIIKIKKI